MRVKVSFSQQLNKELLQLIGYSSTSPKTVVITGPNQVKCELDFVAVDSMSCATRELRLHVPALIDADFDLLRTWGEEFSKRVTYLMENIGPLELDPDAGQILIRSTPPQQQGGTVTFYEVLLQSHSAGNFSLKRYESTKGTPGRSAVDMQTTHEVLRKLVDDLTDTIPANTP